MDFKEKLKQDALQILNTAFISNGIILLGFALKPALKNVQGVLYRTHTENVWSALTSKLKEEFAMDSLNYNERLEAVSKIILKYKGPNAKGWIDRDTWLIWQFGPDDALAESIKYRIYFNVKPDRIVNFVTEFINKIFNYSGYCPKCGSNSAKFDDAKKQIICSTCNNNHFDFYFKVHKPLNSKDSQIMGLLRTDKSVAYAPNKQVLVWLLRIVKQMNASNFMRPTPFYTHEFLPGVGYSVQPGAGEEDRFYKDLGGDERIIFSWGTFIALLLAQALNRAVNAQKRRMQIVYTFLVTNREGLTPGQLTEHLYKNVQTVIASAVDNFVEDPQLDGICKEIEALEEIHAQIK